MTHNYTISCGVRVKTPQGKFGSCYFCVYIVPLHLEKVIPNGVGHLLALRP
jgi:hypothetical protein